MTRFIFVAYIKVVICIVAIIFLFYRLYKERYPGTLVAVHRTPKPQLTFLIIVAVISVSAYFNCFQFRIGPDGKRHFVNYFEFIIHYLGSKYSPELGYFNIYNAMVVADAETTHYLSDDQQIRDLKSYQYISRKEILKHRKYYKSLFSATRWRKFNYDMKSLLDQGGGGALLGRVLIDHGYHVSPVWNASARILASAIPPDKVMFLALLDVLLLGLMFYVLFTCFGWGSMLVAVIFFSVNFISSFSWIGGAFLRYDWLVALILALCFIQRKRYVWAGVGVAYASMIRIFPLMFLAGIIAKGTDKLYRNKKLPTEYSCFFAAFVVTCLLLFGYSCINSKAFLNWGEFAKKIVFHSETLMANNVGFKVVLLTDRSMADLDSLFERYGQPREDVYSSLTDAKRLEARRRFWELTLYAICLMAIFFLLVRVKDDTEAMAWGVFPMFILLTPTNYYFVILMAFIVIFYKRPVNLRNTFFLALLFLIQIISFLRPVNETLLQMTFFHSSWLLLEYLLFVIMVEMYASYRQKKIG